MPTPPRASSALRPARPVPDRAYLDHAGAAPIDPRVAAAMGAALADLWPGAHALHAWSRPAYEALELARARVAALVGADPDWVVFTSGPTEARNLAVKGTLGAQPPGAGVVSSIVEHPVTLAALRTATRDGAPLRLVPVDTGGRMDPAALAGLVDDEVALVSITHAQPEIGTLQDLPTLVAAARSARPDVVVHVDAGDSVGLAPIDLRALDADLLTLGGASLGAPAWTGALVVRPGTRLRPLIEGGAHEHGRRAGTEDLAGIVGLGVAAEATAAEGSDRIARIEALAERLIDGLLRVPDVRLNGPRHGRLPGHVQVSAGWVEAQTLVLALSELGVAASPGSACTAVTRKASPVLEAVGLEPPWTHSAVLFTLGPTTTAAEVEHGIRAFAGAVARLRELSPIAPGRP